MQESSDPDDWAITHLNLGGALQRRGNGGLHPEYMEQAIAVYTEAENIVTREAMPHIWAELQMRLGLAYGQRIDGDTIESIEKAVTCCKSALEMMGARATPVDWEI
jgi:hypothetical protein